MKRVVPTLAVLVAGALAGIALALLLRNPITATHGAGYALHGEIGGRAGEIVLHAGARIEVPFPDDVRRGKSAILAFRPHNEAPAAWSLVAKTGDGEILVLVDEEHEGNVFDAVLAGLVEIGFEHGIITVSMDGDPRIERHRDLADIASVSLQADAGELRLRAVSLVAADWGAGGIPDFRVVAHDEFEAVWPSGGRLAIFALAGLAFAALTMLVEGRLTQSFASVASARLSQIFSFGVLALGLHLCRTALALEGGELFVGAIFGYLRLRFVLARSGLAAPENAPAIGRFLLPLFALAGAFGAFRAASSGDTDVEDSFFLVFVAAAIPFALARLYARLTDTSFERGRRAMGLATVPLAFTALTSLAWVFALPALGWPALASRDRMRHAGPLILGFSLLLIPGLEIVTRTTIPPTQWAPGAVSDEFVADEGPLFFMPKNLLQFVPRHAHSWNYRVEATDFRGNTVAVEKPKDVYRIMVIGGSNVWGDGLDRADQAFPARLEIRLNERFGGGFEVLNGGVRGYNSFQVMVLFTRYAYRFEPDLVVMYMNRNDVDSREGVYRLRELLEDGASAAATREAGQYLRKLAFYNVAVRRFERARHEFPLLAKTQSLALVNTNPPEDTKENYRDIIRKARRIGAKVAFVSEYWGEVRRLTADEGPFHDVRRATRELVKEEDVPYFDAFKAFYGNYPFHEVILPHDHVHMTPQGHDILAGMLVDFLSNERLLE
ncbi:SGNH/GDSL hydrolase family protein [bacterium]|nr:SGNH/GDSL hydrolase family protein [bacterium]